jgi:hypothetical protein
MKLEDVQPAHCHARARRLLAETRAIREEMGRTEDARQVPEVTGAMPRDCYLEAIVAWRKAARLGAELGVEAPQQVPGAPGLGAVRPGHVLQVIDGVLAQIDAVRQRLAIPEAAPEPAIEPARQPSDVLMTLIQVNRELSRALERPFTPSDVYRTVALATAYAARLGAPARPAAFERRRQPAHCYERLEACLARASALIVKRGGSALAVRGAPPDVLPGDVYDLANLVLGEIAYLHSLTPDAAPIHAFEPEPGGHRLPSHVYQLAGTLDAQLASLA